MKQFTFILLFTVLLSNGFAQSSIEKGKFTDTRNDKKYKTVTIINIDTPDTITWMAENLAFKTDSCLAYDNKQEIADDFGYLYSFETAQNACPQGWRLPTEDEYLMLLKIFDHDYQQLAPNGKSQFAALLGGRYSTDDDGFWGLNDMGAYWSSSTTSQEYANVLLVYINDGEVADITDYEKSAYVSVRCVKE